MPSAAALQPHPRPPHRFIVVEGPIGVGKTTLASRLAETFNTEILLEHAAENPFLEKFYEDPRATALPTQLYFLFQRARQLEKLRQTDLFRPAQVADFLMQKDELFARITLNEHELDLYYQVYNRLALDAPLPDLVIYLQAPVDVLLRRIYARGVEFEKRIDEEYLRRVADAYIEFFYHYNASPLLIVNTTEFDIAGNVGDYDLLLHRIGDLSHGRHYFNSSPEIDLRKCVSMDTRLGCCSYHGKEEAKETGQKPPQNVSPARAAQGSDEGDAHNSYHKEFR